MKVTLNSVTEPSLIKKKDSWECWKRTVIKWLIQLSYCGHKYKNTAAAFRAISITLSPKDLNKRVQWCHRSPFRKLASSNSIEVAKQFKKKALWQSWKWKALIAVSSHNKCSLIECPCHMLGVKINLKVDCSQWWTVCEKSPNILAPNLERSPLSP